MANPTLTDVFFKAVKQDLEEQEERNPKAPKFSDLFGTDGYADQLDEIQEDTTSMEEKIESLDLLADEEQEMKRMEAEDTIREQEARWGERREYGN
jgi:hypothetical protein